MANGSNEVIIPMNEFIDNWFSQTEAETNIEIETDNLSSTSDSESTADNLSQIDEDPINATELSMVDGKYKGNNNDYASKRNMAEGMMDIALLTANGNQLRFILTYNNESKTFYISLVLITLSLLLQIAVGIALIYKRQMGRRQRPQRIGRMNAFLVGGVFIVTVVNILLASFTTTDKP